MLYCRVEKVFNVSAVYCRVNHVSIFFTLLAWVGDLRPSFVRFLCPSLESVPFSWQAKIG